MRGEQQPWRGEQARGKDQERRSADVQATTARWQTLRRSRSQRTCQSVCFLHRYTLHSLFFVVVPTAIPPRTLAHTGLYPSRAVQTLQRPERTVSPFFDLFLLQLKAFPLHYLSLGGGGLCSLLAPFQFSSRACDQPRSCVAVGDAGSAALLTVDVSECPGGSGRNVADRRSNMPVMPHQHPCP